MTDVTAVSLAERVFVAFADPGGRTDALCREVVAAGKPLQTFDSRHNQNLLALGAQALESGEEGLGRIGDDASGVECSGNTV